jgi:NAD(P)-dependent dehydrogenase (short-subunit alcohol dehydrogenase family)
VPAVLITGANRGLGFEFARQYLADGWSVYAACRKPAAARALNNLAQESAGKLLLVTMDVTDAAGIRQAAAALQDVAIDVLINCAGIIGASGQRVGHVDYDSWARVLDVNTMGPLRVLEAFGDNLARGEHKLAVTITSGMGSIGDNTTGGSIAYRSSKAAVNMVMRSAAIDLKGRRIVCVVINPGWVKTDMGGPGAPLIPQESVTAMRRLIASLRLKDSGKFYDYSGNAYPW